MAKPIQYPILTNNDDTIYVFGNYFESGTDEWYAERDRLQEIYRAATADEENPTEPDWGLNDE